MDGDVFLLAKMNKYAEAAKSNFCGSAQRQKWTLQEMA
jgi:hypothetical protein